MNCPEHLVFKARWVYVWMYWRDVPRETIPLRIWLNPLRYEVVVCGLGRHYTINRYGAWVHRLPAKLWAAWCKVFSHKAKHIGDDYAYCGRCHKRLGGAA